MKELGQAIFLARNGVNAVGLQSMQVKDLLKMRQEPSKV